MIPTWFAFVCLSAAYWARKDDRILAVMLVSTVFGATAAASVVLMGNAPLTPAMFLLPFLAWFGVKVVGLKAVKAELAWGRPGMWLALFVGWAVLSAIVMPRVFDGDVFVYTTSRGGDAGLGVELVALKPNSTNITQSVYLLAGLAAFVLVAALARRASAADILFKGLVVAGVLNVLAALVNIVEGYTGFGLGLNLLRNANYGITEGHAVGALIRIHGTFTETSAFSAFSVPLFAALLVLWMRGYRRLLTAPLCAVTLTLLVLTTSTTAFVALAATTAVVGFLAAVRVLMTPNSFRFGQISAVVLIVAIGLCVSALFKPEWLAAVWRYVDVTVFQKLASDSGVERLQWNARAWASFVETYGLGVGAGSARGSGWPVVLLGNTGVLGTLLFLVFFVWVLVAPIRTQDSVRASMALATRAALLGVMAAATVSGAVIDLGLLFYLLAGAATGLAAQAMVLAPFAAAARRTRPGAARSGSLATP
jgi:hypothetical protein